MQTVDETSVSFAEKRKKRKLAMEVVAYLSPIIIIIVVFVFVPLAIILFFSTQGFFCNFT